MQGENNPNCKYPHIISRSFFQTAKHFLSQSCSLLRHEPGSSAEGRLRARAEEELQMLQDFMEREHSME